MFDFAVATYGKRFFKRLSGSDVARSGRRGKKQDAGLAAHLRWQGNLEDENADQRLLMPASCCWRPASPEFYAQSYVTRQIAPGSPENRG